MTENAKNPAVTNPSKADSSEVDYEAVWKGLNHIQFIINKLPMSTYEQAIQDKLQSIHKYCSDTMGNDPSYLAPVEAGKRIAPLGEQLQASAFDGVVAVSYGITAIWAKDMESYLV